MLWAGQFVSLFGDRLAMVAFPWVVYRTTGSSFSTGVVLALYALPYVLFGVLAGVVIDRVDKRILMISSDLARAVLVLSVPLVVHWSVPAVYGLGFLTATVGVLFDPCKLAILPELVPGSKLMRANSLLVTAENVTDVIGYAAGGLIVYSLSQNLAFSIDSITFVVSAIALACMSYKPATLRVARLSTKAVRAEAREGLSFLSHHTGLLANTVLVCSAVAGIGACYPLTFLYAARVVGGGARSFGILEASIGAGSLIGAVGLAAVAQRLPKGVAMTVGIAVLGSALALVGVIEDLRFAVVMFFVGGVANAVAIIAIDTYFQQAVPEGMRGRVGGVRLTLTQGIYAGSVLAGAALAGAFQVQALFIACGLVVAVPALIGVFIPDVRRA